MVELSVAGSRGKRMSGKKTPAMDESERAAQRQVNDLESIFSFFFFSLSFCLFTTRRTVVGRALSRGTQVKGA